MQEQQAYRIVNHSYSSSQSKHDSINNHNVSDASPGSSCLPRVEEPDQLLMLKICSVTHGLHEQDDAHVFDPPRQYCGQTLATVTLHSCAQLKHDWKLLPWSTTLYIRKQQTYQVETPVPILDIHHHSAPLVCLCKLYLWSKLHVLWPLHTSTATASL